MHKPTGTKGFALLPRRWITEPTLGRLGRWRCLSRDCELLPEVSGAMIRRMLHAPPSKPSAVSHGMASQTGTKYLTELTQYNIIIT